MKINHTRNFTAELEKIKSGIEGYSTIISGVTITFENSKFIQDDESNGLLFTFRFDNKVGTTAITRDSLGLALTRKRASMEKLYHAIARCVHMDCIMNRCLLSDV